MWPFKRKPREALRLKWAHIAGVAEVCRACEGEGNVSGIGNRDVFCDSCQGRGYRQRR